MSQWSFTGYDASAHMVEETTNAAVAGPQGIIRALTIHAAFGLAFIIAIIASVPDYMNSFFGPLSLNYNPVAQIMFDVMEQHYGNGRYAGLTLPGTPPRTAANEFFGDALPSAFVDDRDASGDYYIIGRVKLAAPTEAPEDYVVLRSVAVADGQISEVSLAP